MRMVLHFLPAMTGIARKSIWTTIFIIHQELISFPIRTLTQFVVILLGLPTEVLPVMAILTLTPVMFELVEWTIYCFEVEQVEVHIFPECVNKRDCYFLDTMGEGTVNAIFTLCYSAWELLAELAFILIRPV